MKIPIYILGILKRYGSMHGYQIKKIISEQVSDFTQIKLPVIYYHLEKMKEKGLLSSKKDSNKENKTIYSITTKGEKEFSNQLESVYDYKYKPEFINDALFYFMDSIDNHKVCEVMEEYIKNLESDIDNLRKHREIVEKFLSDSSKKMSNHIFEHHTSHYDAELLWAKDVAEKLKSR
jgi:DNA-binding PadR family transcriptional regulator